MILNQQRRVRVPLQALDEFLARACKALRVPFDAVTVCLVTDAEMARWNRVYRGKNRPTDVLSFPIEANAKPRRAKRKDSGDYGDCRDCRDCRDYLGDIAIAPEVARRNAKQFGREFGDEMRILILHGILHLMGYDHETDTGQMERREKRLRRSLGLADNGLADDRGFD
jgi:probable rRNA maturation factor